MRARLNQTRFGAALAAFALVAGGVWYFFLRPDPGDARLNAFVHSKPPVPIVFTSRSEALSFVAAAPSGEEFHYPGQRLWQAREGRLRLLTPRGTVHELTWGKQLPDGSTLIDVMSPSISLDGKRVYFAGRKGGDDAGHFRLYEVALEGGGLRQFTGGADDVGCAAVPPMRFAADGSLMTDEQRRSLDFDDIDPIELNVGRRRIAFASSRTPDLGRDHARRSTNLWLMKEDGVKEPITANRSNDRWPFLFPSRTIGFSLWSRNREVITADGTDIRPYEQGMACATQPTDDWFGAFQQVAGSQFGHLVKAPVPVWRPRPLFNGRVAFMTSLENANLKSDEGLPHLVAVQSAAGLLANSPSSLSADSLLPKTGGGWLFRAPEFDDQGRRLYTATPSPCPPHDVVLSAAALDDGELQPSPGRFGIYLANDNWPSDGSATMSGVNMRLLFDDPEFVDAEPVAVYPRHIEALDGGKSAAEDYASRSGELALANGSTYRGPQGLLFITSIYSAQMTDLPGQQTDVGQAPIFGGPPNGSIDHLRIYAARRDRFDDPHQLRVPGDWELIVKAPVKDGTVSCSLPIGAPTVLAGFDKDGRVVRWTTPAKDSLDRHGTFYAYAGDHYSLVKPGGRPFCTGCHAGHNGFPAAMQDQHRERIR
jgi:hypothetical protein